jgi:hypothetical protein
MSEIVFQYWQHCRQRSAVLEYSSNVGRFSVIDIEYIRTFEDLMLMMEAVVYS